MDPADEVAEEVFVFCVGMEGLLKHRLPSGCLFYPRLNRAEVFVRRTMSFEQRLVCVQGLDTELLDERHVLRSLRIF